MWIYMLSALNGVVGEVILQYYFAFLDWKTLEAKLALKLDLEVT